MNYGVDSLVLLFVVDNRLVYITLKECNEILLCNPSYYRYLLSPSYVQQLYFKYFKKIMVLILLECLTRHIEKFVII